MPHRRSTLPTRALRPAPKRPISSSQAASGLDEDEKQRPANGSIAPLLLEGRGAARGGGARQEDTPEVSGSDRDTFYNMQKRRRQALRFGGSGSVSPAAVWARPQSPPPPGSPASPTRRQETDPLLVRGWRRCRAPA